MSQEPDAGAPVNDDAFVISRVLQARCESVFYAWADSEQLLRWFVPRGFTITPKTVDIRARGVFHYAMGTPDGKTVWGRWAFREVAVPARIVFDATFSDEAGGLTRNPWAVGWPEHVLTTVNFAEHDGRTTLTMFAVPIDATAAEHAVFRAGHAPMHSGWSAMLEQLAQHLVKA
jgi:uncharacterized protein YndB with AHSA1/START domain